MTYISPPAFEEESSLLRVDVPPSGDPSYARFAFIGEAPGTEEMSQQEPFVGSAGTLLSRILNIIGLPRHQLYVTNLCKTKLPKNDSKHLNPIWNQLQNLLIQELSQLNTDYLVVLGETAMKALMDDPSFDKIGKYQGSVYLSDDFPHLKESLPGKKILITYHPASALPYANPSNFYVIMHDLQKFLDLEKDPTLLETSNQVKVEPTYSEVLEFLGEVRSQGITAFDIEATPSFVTCLGFTATPNKALCIPFLTNSGNYWTLEEEVSIWTEISRVLGDPSIKKVMQNGMFDMMFLLRTMDIKTEGFTFDTMLARHLAWADLRKGLDAIVSCYTYYPYYKDEGKQAFLKLIKDWHTHWHYNAKDCLYTHQVKPPLEAELDKLNAQPTFEHLMKLHKPLIEMEYRGIRVNQDGMIHRKNQLYKQLNALKNGLTTVSGQTINHRSAKQMKEYFYEKLSLKPYVNRTTKKPTLDDTALKRIARAGKKGSAEAKIIRKIRKIDKLLGTYFEVSIDSDNRLRCQYKISGTSSGRLSSSATFFGTGTNLQNIPSSFKKFLCPDPGYLLAEIDLAQAEAVVVAYVSQDANMIKSFESGIDCHSYNACQVFGRDIDEFMDHLHQGDPTTKRQRKLAKAVVHASNYAMGYRTFSLLIEEPEAKAKSLLEAYHRRFPGLRQWHRQIDQKIYRDRILHNLYGRPKRFLGNLDYNLFKAAYSYIPQSTVAEHLNRGMVRISDDEFLSSENLQLLATVHDSVLVQLKADSPAEVEHILSKCQFHLDKPLYAKGTSFRISCDFKLSTLNWKDMTELGELSQNEISQAVPKYFK